MPRYRVTLADGQAFEMLADMTDAAAPISARFGIEDDDEWQGTPYQTADARHDRVRAAELVASYYSTGDDDCIEVDEVEALDHD